MFRLRLLVAIVAITAASPVASQPPRVGGLNVSLDRLGVEHGLPSQAVSELTIAADGRLWAVSSGRLVSFDGYAFEVHDLSGAAGPGAPGTGRAEPFGR